MFEIIYSIISSLIALISKWGYLGIFIGMTIESSIFPLPSEIIMIPAGALAANGNLSFGLAFLMGVLGSICGAFINYFLALFLGRRFFTYIADKYGKILFISKENLERSDRYFQKHGEVTTFIGRLLPGVRHLISIPAGFSRMNIFKFSLFTGIGAGLWVLILMYIGYFVGNNTEWLNANKDIITLVLILFSVVVIMIYALWKKRKSKRKLA